MDIQLFMVGLGFNPSPNQLSGRAHQTPKHTCPISSLLKKLRMGLPLYRTRALKQSVTTRLEKQAQAHLVNSKNRYSPNPDLDCSGTQGLGAHGAP